MWRQNSIKAHMCASASVELMTSGVETVKQMKHRQQYQPPTTNNPAEDDGKIVKVEKMNKRRFAALHWNKIQYILRKYAHSRWMSRKLSSFKCIYTLTFNHVLITCSEHFSNLALLVSLHVYHFNFSATHVHRGWHQLYYWNEIGIWNRYSKRGRGRAGKTEKDRWEEDREKKVILKWKAAMMHETRLHPLIEKKLSRELK